ncbi:glycerol-3-phosphate dehydrogenase C-terminal domain-containing protein [Chryseomicrobium palamuruense]|uniref:Glycerol-3-phosphate dehydrogenase C-terminal domain-containing protein n=1 Tax=Chryseomicrobium palamuruense TaxID=682973 RepID=A0ABV8UTR8_9BACL
MEEAAGTSIMAMLQYGIEYEMVLTPSDFFIRQTGNLLFDIEKVEKYKHLVIEKMKEMLNGSSEQSMRCLEELNDRLVEVAVN